MTAGWLRGLLVAVIVVGLAAFVGAGSTIATFSDAHNGKGNLTAANDFGNSGPVADAGGPYSVDEGNSITLDGTGSTASQGNLDYSWEIISGNGSLSAATTATPTYDAPSNVNSDITVTVELTVTDGSSSSDTDTADITVRNVSAADAPSVDSLAVTTTGDQNRKFEVAADLSDPTGDGDQLKNATIEFIRTQNGNVEDSFEDTSIGGDSATINYTSSQLKNTKEYEIVVTVYDTVGGDSGSASEIRTTG